MGNDVWYNENDPFAAAWLRELVAAEHLPAGDVDERSILEVEPRDLAGYDYCHFFAGIGGWPYALQLAGWPADRPVWTGSCPCQPFSSAGRQGGAADERHLWPRWLRLVRECRPDAIFGEQVEGAVGFGWIDRVFADLEAEGYACGTAVLGAHSLNAPHIRQRLFWVAHAAADGWRARSGDECRSESGPALAHNGSAAGGLGDAAGAGCGQGRALAGGSRKGDQAQGTAERSRAGDGIAGGMGDADPARLPASEWQERRGARARHERAATGEPGGAFWSDAVWLPCLDGKARRAQPGVFPLADGVSARVGRLRGYGNAVVPPVAAEFVRAYMSLDE